MDSISSRPALASPAATAPAPPDSAAPAADLHHPARVALVRLLARQAAGEGLAQAQTTEVEDADATSLSLAPGERP